MDVIISLCESHYGLKNVNLKQLIEELARFGNSAAQHKKADVGFKVINILQLIVLQRNEKFKKDTTELLLSDVINIFSACLNQLLILAGTFKGDIEEFKKSKQFKKVNNLPTQSKCIIIKNFSFTSDYAISKSNFKKIS